MIKVRIEVPKGQRSEAAISTGALTGAGRPSVTYLRPGEQLEWFIQDGHTIDVCEAKAGTKAEKTGL